MGLWRIVLVSWYYVGAATLEPASTGGSAVHWTTPAVAVEKDTRYPNLNPGRPTYSFHEYLLLKQCHFLFELRLHSRLLSPVCLVQITHPLHVLVVELPNGLHSLCLNDPLLLEGLLCLFHEFTDVLFLCLRLGQVAL